VFLIARPRWSYSLRGDRYIEARVSFQCLTPTQAGERLCDHRARMLADASGQHPRRGMHCATLIHDDLLDGAAVRRGAATVNAAEGMGSAVLSGDLLMAATTNRFGSLLLVTPWRS